MAFGVDIFLSDGQPGPTNTHSLWTKRSGYYKGGLEALRAIARCPLEALQVGVFAENEERIGILQTQVNATHTAQVVVGHAGYPEVQWIPSYSSFATNTSRLCSLI